MKKDLFLEINEYLTFKDGDVIAGDDGFVAIFKCLEIGRRRTFCLYAALQKGLLCFHGSGWVLENTHKANEEEKKRIVEKLKESIEPQAKECLIRLFGIEEDEEKEHELKPYDRVLVRNNNREEWHADFFSHITKLIDRKFACSGACFYQCIPYEGNEYLLGKTENPE